MAEAGREGHLVEGQYITQVQSHCSLEPHAAVARWADGHLEVWASTQSVHDLAQDLAQLYGLSATQVTVHSEFVGGAFGAKVGLQMETRAAVDLALAAGAPVRVALDRHEELMVGGLRPGQRMELALGATNQGDFLGLTYSALSEAGVSVGQNTGLLVRLMYPSSHKDLDDYDVVTHTPPGKPFRGPGGPSAYFALESAVSEMAERLALDPLALRRRWDPNPMRRALYDWVEGLPVWSSRAGVAADKGRYRRGVGLAGGAWYAFWDPHAQVRLDAGPEGLVASTASQDMGNGTRALVAWAIAEVLGLAPDQVEVRLGDSREVYGPLSSGSRTAASLGPAAAHAARQLRAALAELADELGTRGAEEPGGLRHEGGLLPWSTLLRQAPPMTFVGRRERDEERAFLPFAVADLKVGRHIPAVLQLTEVEVDTRLGRVRARACWTGVGVGKLRCPPVARSQVEGAVVQGLSFALYEDRRLCPRTGRLLSHNLDDYRIAALGDVPPIHLHFETAGFEKVQGGGVGLGEISGVAVAASVAAAVHHATGWRPRELPLRPDLLFRGLS